MRPIGSVAPVGAKALNEADLKPAYEFAINFGVKAVVYGPPGGSKTPTCLMTSPNPVCLMSEPGFLSARAATTPTFAAFNPGKVDEFMTWFKGSHEAKKYDTLVWDSVSQACEKFIELEMGGTSKAGNEQHGMRVYGKMARWMYGHLSDLYFMPQKHIILISKMQNFEINGSIYKRPYFPGKELPVRVPHLFDLITCLGNWNVPGVGEAKAFRTKEQFDMMARDRSGMLAEYEPAHVGNLIAKCMTKPA